MKKYRILIFTVVGLLAAAAVYWFFFRGNNKTVTTYTTAVVTRSAISNTVTATGTVEPVKQVSVGTQVSGVIKKIYVDYNSIVKKGDLLAELDKTPLLASLASMKADLASSASAATYQEATYNRIKELYEKQAVSKTDYEAALYQYSNAKANLAKMTSEVNRANTNLGYTMIYSPIDGVVLSRAVDEGQTVAASFSTPTLFTIAQDLTKMQVVANVDEADIGQVKEGQKVTFTVDAYQGEEFSGTVTQVRMNATTTSNVVTYKVIVKADNPDEKLLPGLTATISIYTLELKDVLTLNAQAFNFNPDMEMVKLYNAQFSDKPVENSVKNTPPQKDKHKKTVWIKDASGIHPIEVTIGSNDGINSEVVSGLKLGEEVVILMGYQTAATVVKKDGTSESPFMPKPPGKKK